MIPDFTAPEASAHAIGRTSRPSPQTALPAVLRLILTDGRIVQEVRHPELAVVGQSTVAVGLARRGDPESHHDRSATIPLVDVLRIEPVGSSPAPSA